MTPTDENLIAEFLERNQRIVGKIARSFSFSESEFDDLFQEICISLWAAIDKVPANAKESTWVYRVSLNRAISWKRKKATYLKHLVEFWRLSANENESQTTSHNSQTELLYAAIRQLSDLDRSAIVLHLDQISGAEMAEILGISPAAVRKRVSRAKERLTKVIREMETENDK